MYICKQLFIRIKQENPDLTVRTFTSNVNACGVFVCVCVWGGGDGGREGWRDRTTTNIVPKSLKPEFITLKVSQWINYIVFYY